MDGGTWWATVCRVTESDMTERLDLAFTSVFLLWQFGYVMDQGQHISLIMMVLWMVASYLSVHCLYSL